MVCLRSILLAGCTVIGCAAADYQIHANIRYAPYGETLLDILQPRHPAMKNRTGVLMIHGGGWVGGSKEEALPFCLPFVEQDFVVANVEYRLAGVAPAPAALQDVLAAAKWFHDHAAEYRVDPDRIIAVGVSAGGELALLAGMLPANNDFGPAARMAAVIDFYGIADVRLLLDGPTKRDYAVQWLGSQPGASDLAGKLSPLTYVRKETPPVLAIHGDADDVVPYQQSVQLTTALKQAGAKAELITIPGARHGFSNQQAAAIWPQVFKWTKKMKLNP